MAKRGRKSTAQLSVVEKSPVTAVDRPEPPPELSDEQAQEWVAVVNRMRADWFPRETHPMLAQYCRHVVMARRIDELIEQAIGESAFDIDHFERLQRMQEKESRAMTALARSMRMTQQAQTNHKKNPGTSVRKPWK